MSTNRSLQWFFVVFDFLFVCLCFSEMKEKWLNFSYERPFQIWPMKYTVSFKSFNQLVLKFSFFILQKASVSNKLANEANKLDNLDKTYVKPAEKQAVSV